MKIINKKQYQIVEGNKICRALFFDFITKNYKLKVWYPFKRENFIESTFPFIVDFKKKMFWVCDSITCCACAAQNHQLITIEKFMMEEHVDDML